MASCVGSCRLETHSTVTLCTPVCVLAADMSRQQVVPQSLDVVELHTIKAVLKVWGGNVKCGM